MAVFQARPSEGLQNLRVKIAAFHLPKDSLYLRNCSSTARVLVHSVNILLKGEPGPPFSGNNQQALSTGVQRRVLGLKPALHLGVRVKNQKP
jgi:hypothetical protein